MSDVDTEAERAAMTSTPAGPPVTEALRAQARAHPGSWVYAIDPYFDGADDVPPEGIQGAWRSDDSGRLAGDFTPNPRYVPSPLARGWDEPATPLERTLQLVRAGYLPPERLARDFAGAEVVVFDRPGGGIFLSPATDGGQLVYAYTDAVKAAASGYSGHAGVRGRELAASLPDDVRIAVNPGTDFVAVLSPAEVVAQ